MKNFPKISLLLAISVIVFASALEFESAEDSNIGQIGTSAEDETKEPLDIDFISGDLGGSSIGTGPTQIPPAVNPSVPSTPEFGTSSVFDHYFGGIFNRDDVFGFGGFPQFGGFNFDYKPWWKGPNVCTEREEDIEDPDETKKDDEGEPSFISHFHLNIESCKETNNKHICKKVKNEGGRKQTVKITKQCCHGFARSNGGFCEKIDLLSVVETAEKLGAKEFVKTAVQTELREAMDANITIFAPIDSAFTDSIDNSLLEKNLVVVPLGRNRRQPISGSVAPRDLVLNHIVSGRWVNIEDIDNEEILQTDYRNATIRMNVFPKLMIPRRPSKNDDESINYPYLYTANCVPIVRPNKLASNGVVHMISKVLTPVEKTLMQMIKEREDMTIMRSILEKTDMDKMLEGLNDDEDSKRVERQYTIFAPTDRAFEQLDPQLKRKLKEGSGCAINILKNHMLDMTFCSAAVADNNAKTSAFNILGEKMTFERVDDEKVNSTNEIDESDEDEIRINGKATIIEADLMATNGVIHVIDTLLETKSGLPISSMLNYRNLSIFKKLMDYGNFDDEFDSLNNATYFIPTDDAFENSKIGKYWIDQLEKAPQKLKNNAQLKEFLEYHVSEPLIKTCDLKEDMLPTKSGNELRVNLYSTLPSFVNVMNRATVNCARLIHFDDESCGSVVHQVDKVLEPPQKSLLDMLKEKEEYSMFLKFMQQANMTSLLDTTEDSFTMFVPKDDVFREVIDWYKEMLDEKNQDELTDLIQSHIVPDVLCCAGIVRSDFPFVRSVESINKHHLHLNRDRRPKVQNAGVVKCDIVATNGIIHEINDVIIVNPKMRPNGRPQEKERPIYGSFLSFPQFGSFPF